MNARIVVARWLYLPDDAIEDLRVLASLSASKIELLRRHIDSREYAPSYKSYLALAELLDISDESAAKLSGFIHYVQTQRIKRKQPGDTVPTEFESFLNRAAKSAAYSDEAQRLAGFIQSQRPLLGRLFSDSVTHTLSEKVRGLETGPAPHLHTFRTYLDLRPVYNADASAILEYRAVIMLGMTIHHSTSDEFKDIVIQLVEGDLAELKKQFQRLDEKLAVLKKEQQVATDTDSTGVKT